MRLDVDQSFPPIKLRSFHQTTFLNQLNDEINQLPKEIFAIERTCLTRFRERNSFDDEQQIYRTGLILRCKLIEKHQPILPALQLQITTAYPEQAPEILSLTKSNPPRLDFVADDDHPFFEQLSLIFVSHVFKLRPKHTVTEILHLWVRNFKDPFRIVIVVDFSVSPSRQLCENNIFRTIETQEKSANLTVRI